MANAFIADNRLVTAAGVALTHSTEVANYPAENVQIFQPGDVFRSSVMNPAWVQAGFSEVVDFDLVAGLYTNATAHRTLLARSNNLNTSPWTGTSVTVFEGDTDQLPVGGLGTVCAVNDTTDNTEHKVVQQWTGPGLGSLAHTSLMLDCFVGVPTTQAIDELRLRWEDDLANYVQVDFDLSAGTVGSPATGGSNPPTSASAAITAVAARVGASATWYRISLYATPAVTNSTYDVSIFLMDGLGNTTYIGPSPGDSVYVSGVTFQMGSTLRTPSATGAAGGAIYRLMAGSGDLTDWDHVVTADKSDLPFIHVIHAFSSMQSLNDPRFVLHDPLNADGYVEIGNLVVAEVFQPARNVDSGWSVGYDEEGGQNRSLGGQLYRPVNKRYRRLKVTHDWLTEAEANDEALELDRRVGRSEGLLLVNDPGGTYELETAIWGLQDDIGEVVHKTYSTSASGQVFRKNWHIVEALP